MLIQCVHVRMRAFVGSQLLDKRDNAIIIKLLIIINRLLVFCSM